MSRPLASAAIDASVRIPPLPQIAATGAAWNVAASPVTIGPLSGSSRQAPERAADRVEHDVAGLRHHRLGQVVESQAGDEVAELPGRS